MVHRHVVTKKNGYILNSCSHVLLIINITNNIPLPSLHPGSACLYKRNQPETDVSAVSGPSRPLESQQNWFCMFLPLPVPRKVLCIFNLTSIWILVMYVWADGVACDLAVSSCAKCWPGPGHWGGLLHDDSYLSHTEVFLGHYIVLLKLHFIYWIKCYDTSHYGHIVTFWDI